MRQCYVLNRLSTQRKAKKAGSGNKTSQRGVRQKKHYSAANPTLMNAFAILALGVVSCKRNWITLSDLLFWAKCETISWHTNVLAVPREMKFVSRADKVMLSAIMQPDLDHLKLRERMFFTGSVIQLGDCNLGAPDTKAVISTLVRRYLCELSLPQDILNFILNKIPTSLLLQAPKFSFATWKTEKDLNNLATRTPPVPSLDVFCMALILFALKFIYNLDDMVEHAVSKR